MKIIELHEFFGKEEGNYNVIYFNEQKKADDKIDTYEIYIYYIYTHNVYICILCIYV